MKKLNLTLLLITLTFCSSGQDITGSWNGSLDFLGTELTIVFNIKKTDSVYVSTMDSPDQGVYGISVDMTIFKDSILNIKMGTLGIQYNGTLSNVGAIMGTYIEMGQSYPLTLTREKIKREKIIRYQDPQQPYPYYTEEVLFTNIKDSVTIAGTLTLPQKTGKFPVVVLISGSGPQNRDGEILGHKPFLVLADYLTRQGIGVLRYDDRGVYESTGDFSSTNSAGFSNDVESAVEYLKSRKEINIKQIGLIGHSEGGLIAPMVAARSEDIAYIILMAGTGIPGDELLITREELMLKTAKWDEKEIKAYSKKRKEIFDAIIKINDIEKLNKKLVTIYNNRFEKDPENIPVGLTKEQFINSKAKVWANVWMSYFIKYDPAENLKKVTCPVLAINGEKDVQVPSKKNLEAIKKHLESNGNKNVTIREFSSMNHLFQECKTGSPNEYSKIEQTFSPIALEEISSWILTQIETNK
jgi:dienelactone hydrolase